MADFLLEVGCEELPHRFLCSVPSQWEEMIPLSLKELHITYESLEIYTTPRRLALIIYGLPTHAESYIEEIKGPPVSTALQDGELSSAGLGFIKKYNLTLDNTEVRSTYKGHAGRHSYKGDFLYGLVEHKGLLVSELLKELLVQWIINLKGDRFMHWGDGSIMFPRPIKWLVALLGKEVLPTTLVNGTGELHTGRLSRGHRVLCPGDVSISTASNYVSEMRSAFVEVCTEERTSMVLEGINQLCDEVSGYVHRLEPLISEVVNLVEWPTCVMGNFDKSYLSLPTEVITTIMVSHQRYFPIYCLGTHYKHALLPYFITVSNGDLGSVGNIRDGNERVLKARLDDGMFFYKQDIKQPLENYVPLLGSVTYQEGLGTLLDKTHRIQLVSQYICSQWGSYKHEEVQRTALLCKADLVTQVVREFPELQGIMGSIYARLSGESQAVCDGIKDHYDGGLSFVGQVVHIADGLDTLIGFFTLGKVPTGSSDPHGLRRVGKSIINTVVSNHLNINIEDLLDLITTPRTALLVKDFLLSNLIKLFEENGYALDVVHSIKFQLKDLRELDQKCDLVTGLKRSVMFEDAQTAFVRAVQLSKEGTLSLGVLDPTGLIDEGLLIQREEQELYSVLLQSLSVVLGTGRKERYLCVAFFKDIMPSLIPVTLNFLDSVFVMDENPGVRTNRLNLLGLVRNYSLLLCDFTKINKT